MAFVWHVLIAVLLTILTQIGGVAWLVSRLFRRKIAAFLVLYVAATVAVVFVAPQFGRVALPCFGSQPAVMQSPLYCALNRNYVAPELAASVGQAAKRIADKYPGTQTLLLDGNFPFFDGFPLLPHLSHADGRKVDIAFYYRDEKGFLDGATRSPIGYFAFEDGPTDCPAAWPSMRWDLGVLQEMWHPYEIEPARTKALLQILLADEDIGKIFLEPHLQSWLGLSHPKLRFQGCRAARHDDHIHIQLR